MPRKRLVGEHFRADGKPKRRFPTREAAVRFADKHGHTNLCVYKCDFCGGYHYATQRLP